MESLGESPAIVTNTSKDVVALTYCDAGFAFIWPTFMKCYLQALGCSGDVGPEWCGPLKPKLIDLAMESPKPGQTGGSHCVHKGPPVQATSDANSFSLLQLTPPKVPLLLATGMAEHLSLGHDVLRLDADAFLMEDPMPLFQQFPHADIVSSLDAADCNNHCWYYDAAYIRRHGGKDPLEALGFMMNTGLTYFRSNSRTIRLTRAASEALASGKSSFEQTALNEELLDLNCSWSEPEKLPSGGNASQNWNVLLTTPLLGKCADGLKVVVLPYNKMTRSLDMAPSAVSMHPGGPTDDKLSMLPTISALCDQRAKSKAV